MTRSYLSWGRTFQYKHRVERPIQRKPEAFSFLQKSEFFLPYGMGRSYGDSCLNEDHTLIVTDQLDHFISFNPSEGILTCEAGVSLEDILKVVVPHGYFLPVSPGTKFVTLGGAIANDIHGKNHHTMGCIGRHILSFELLRTQGDGMPEPLTCSPAQNTELFHATIGGLGLTGIILSATLRLKQCEPWFRQESVKFGSLDEFFQLSKESDASFEYTVAWVDCLAKGSQMGRGHFLRANAVATAQKLPRKIHRPPQLSVPFRLPNQLLNPTSIACFNQLYFHRQLRRQKKAIVHYEPFFYPLDKVGHWNLIYGKRGFYQYQFVVPTSEKAALSEVFKHISSSGMASFLAVLKQFGEMKSPGLLSFPRPGFTLALDFPNTGAPVLELFETLDAIVASAGGRIYPGKDARWPGHLFRQSYPEWEGFEEWIDPKFSSSLWRRLRG